MPESVECATWGGSLRNLLSRERRADLLVIGGPEPQILNQPVRSDYFDGWVDQTSDIQRGAMPMMSASAAASALSKSQYKYNSMRRQPLVSCIRGLAGRSHESFACVCSCAGPVCPPPLCRRRCGVSDSLSCQTPDFYLAPNCCAGPVRETITVVR